MVCEDDGDCYNVKNATVLATLQEAFTAVWTFFVLLADYLCSGQEETRVQISYAVALHLDILYHFGPSCTFLATNDSRLSFCAFDSASCFNMHINDFRPNAYKTTAVRNKEYLFSVLYPAVAILLMYLTLPALRHAVFPCCYNSDEDNKSDRVFLLTRGSSASGSPAPSEQSNVNTVTHQPIISYPNNSVVPYNPQAQQFQTFPVPNVYPQVFPQGYPQASSQNFPQHYPHNYPQGQPIYFPIPITFYNPSHVPNRSNELPVVQ
ncbi:hypothetical protein CAEBREN_06278 [Caenorhabditis brenneri]|uniref:Uncharacterized protein n=1 Tax=Caenorhabditis brenneri TaxID=135651 RepID=G0MHM1_CAEBE|nr:hypothetical protein CAEBREN_06278 [Caenorhabditis brenneri]